MKLVKAKSGIYSVRYTANGQTTSTSLRTSNKKIAQEEFNKIKAVEDTKRAGAATRDAVAKIVTGSSLKFNEVLKQFVEWREMQGKAPSSTHQYHMWIQSFATSAGIGDSPISSVTSEMVSDYVNKEDKAKSSTKTLRLTAIKAFFEFASIRQYCLSNPAAIVSVNARKLTHTQKERAVKVPFTKKEYKKIISHLSSATTAHSNFFYVGTILSYWTGLRLGDIASLEWDSIGQGTLAVWTDKSNKRVELPTNAKETGDGIIQKALDRIPLEDDTYCFPEERLIYLDQRLKARFSIYYKRVLNALDIEGKSFHCLRHSFVTRLAKSGMELEDIAKLVGHSSTDTTEIYNH